MRFKTYITDYFDGLHKVIDDLKTEEIEAVIEKLLDAYDRGEPYLSLEMVEVLLRHHILSMILTKDYVRTLLKIQIAVLKRQYIFYVSNSQ